MNNLNKEISLSLNVEEITIIGIAIAFAKINADTFKMHSQEAHKIIGEESAAHEIKDQLNAINDKLVVAVLSQGKENKMTDTKQILDLYNFTRDTAGFDPKAEIAVMISGIPVTIPIRGVTNTTIKDDSKNFVLLHISHEDIMQAWNFVKEKETSDS